MRFLTDTSQFPLLDEIVFTQRWSTALYGGPPFAFEGLVRLPDGDTAYRSIFVTGRLRPEEDGASTSVVTRNTCAEQHVAGYELGLCVTRKNPGDDESHILHLHCTTHPGARLVHDTVIGLLTLPTSRGTDPLEISRILAIARSVDAKMVDG